MEFRILGPLEIRDDGGRAIDVPGTRQRALLAVLLLHAGEVVSTDRLLETAWADAPPAAGGTAVRVRVSQLRKALGAGDRLLTRAPGYLLRVERDELDLHRFERMVADGDRALEGGDPATAAATLEQALALWRGPALADLAYEAFAQAPIMRLEELRIAARERLIGARLDQGRHAGLLGELRELVAEHPLRERLWGDLMLALYRDGRQADALETYRAARRTLVEEIGIEPGPELRALERRILAQDPALAGGRPAARPRRTVVATPAATVAAPGLVALGRVLARHAGAELLLAALVPDEAALADAGARLAALRRDAAAGGDDVRVAAFTSPDPVTDTIRLTADHDAALLLVDLAPEALGRGPLGPRLAGVLRGVTADVAVVAGAQREGTPGGPVVVPFAGGAHEWAALEVGGWLAGALHVPLRLAGTRAVPRDGRRDASRLLASASLALQRGLGIASDSVLADPGTAGMLAVAQGAAAVVAGLSERWPRDGIGAARAAIARDAPCPVVLVRHGTSPGGLAPPRALTRFTWSMAGALSGASADGELVREQPPLRIGRVSGRRAGPGAAPTADCGGSRAPAWRRSRTASG